jgi:hypothetical protein
MSRSTLAELRLKVAEAAIVLEHHFNPDQWKLAYTGLDKYGRKVGFDAKEHCLALMAERIQLIIAGFHESHFKASITLEFKPGEFTLTAHEPSETRALLKLRERLSDTCDKLGLSDLIPSAP